jgi:molybdate transport system substrate-binding protein
MNRRAFLALLLPAVLGFATPAPPTAPAAAEKRTVRVAAAANLKDAAAALAEAYQAQHPDVEIAVSLGASGTFFAQLQNGAPFDVFLSADREYPDQVVAAKLGAAADLHVYAIGKLVAWLPPGSTLTLAPGDLSALATPAVKRIAIANPAVAPFGRAAEAALRAAGVYDAVKEKLVLGASVGQAAQFATTGAAEAAFLPYSLTFGKELAGGKVVPVAEKLYPRMEQAGVVLAAARDPALARDFLAFVLGERGRAVLARFGYALP